MNRFSSLLAGLLLALAACSPPGKGEIPFVDSPLPEFPRDVRLIIRKHERLPDGAYRFEADNQFEGRKVGLIAVLAPGWSARSVPQPAISLHVGVVTLKSAGPSSDALLQGLDRIYGSNLTPTAMRPERRLSAIGLEGDPSQPEKGRLRIKLFNEAQSERNQAEFFLQVDLAKGVLELCEKDVAFRKAVIRALVVR